MGAGHAGLARLGSAGETTSLRHWRRTLKAQMGAPAIPRRSRPNKRFVCPSSRLREAHSRRARFFVVIRRDESSCKWLFTQTVAASVPHQAEAPARDLWRKDLRSL